MSWNSEENNKRIAQLVESIQADYKELIALADQERCRISFTMSIPEDAAGGHNQDVGVYWNPSSQYC